MNIEVKTQITETNLKWVRADDGIIGGVCLGLARQLGVDPWIVRIAWLFSICFMGTGFLAYILCLIALPRTDRLEKANEKMVLGVCLRLAKRESIEIGLTRLIALILLVVSCGTAIIGYCLLYFFLPTSTADGSASNRKSII